MRLCVCRVGGVSPQSAWQSTKLQDQPSRFLARSAQPRRAVAGRQAKEAELSLASARRPAPRGCSSPPAGPPSVTPRGRSSGKPRARVAGEHRRRVEPEPLTAANRATAGEEPQRRKKESAAESKRLIGGRLSGSGSLGLRFGQPHRKQQCWATLHSSSPLSLRPLCRPRKVSLALSVRARRNHRVTSSQGRRILTNCLVQPSLSFFPPPRRAN